MKTEIFENVTIAYMRNTGEYGVKNKELMETFKDFLKKNHILGKEAVILGIALDNPNIIPANELRYDVGLIVSENQNYGLEKRNIDDGTYAIFEVSHTLQGVQDFWANIPKLTADLNVDYEKPIIERYTFEKVNNHLCEFCIPIK